MNRTGTCANVIQGEPSDPRNITKTFFVPLHELNRRKTKIKPAEAVDIVRRRYATGVESPPVARLLLSVVSRLAERLQS